jgi:hypothetical protein
MVMTGKQVEDMLASAEAHMREAIMVWMGKQERTPIAQKESAMMLTSAMLLHATRLAAMLNMPPKAFLGMAKNMYSDARKEVREQQRGMPTLPGLPS